MNLNGRLPNPFPGFDRHCRTNCLVLRIKRTIESQPGRLTPLNANPFNRCDRFSKNLLPYFARASPFFSYSTIYQPINQLHTTMAISNERIALQCNSSWVCQQIRLLPPDLVPFSPPPRLHALKSPTDRPILPLYCSICPLRQFTTNVYTPSSKASKQAT